VTEQWLNITQLQIGYGDKLVLNRNQLHQYQLDMINKAQPLEGIGLFMEPGLGKTVTALTIIAEQFQGKTLVVAPKRVAENVWDKEIANWHHLSSLSLSKVLGTPKQRQDALKVNSSIYIVNLENLVWLLDEPITFDNLVIDESSRFKDPSTKRFKALKKHLRSFKKRMILTGTPSPQGISDLWSQVGILDLGKRLESSLTKFRDKYLMPDQINRQTRVVYSWKPKQGAADIVQKAISDICFSLRAQDYLELPPQTMLYHPLTLSVDERKVYEAFKKDAVMEIKDFEITAATAATLAGKLLQYTSGAVYTEDHGWVETNNAKLEFMETLMAESITPTLIFYHFKHSLTRLQELFPQAQVLSDDNMQAWREGKVPIMLAHPQSGGIGLNLQCNAGDLAQVVWFDLPWSSENYVQANARIYRQGQTKPVIIHHLVVENSIDGLVVKALEGKISKQDALLEALNLH
jgi:SNF2 family DNA or RNA helicase